MSRVVHIGDDVGRLQVRNRQLRAYHRDTKEILGTAPLEDVDLVLADSTRGIFFDTHTLQAMLAEDTTLVMCDNKHMPVGLLLPLAGSWNHTRILHAQIEMSAARRKRAWQQIVQAKIRAQARNLPHAHPVTRRLTQLATEVRSGDTSNTEATAAKSYWSALFGQPFRRETRTRQAENGALDYGYAVLRSIVARSVVGAGMHPALGLHHIGRDNPYCLVDDLIEPLRPAIDSLVLKHETEPTLSPQLRAVLAKVVETPFTIGDRNGPLTFVMDIYAANVRQYILGETDKIETPTLIYDTRTQQDK